MPNIFRPLSQTKLINRTQNPVVQVLQEQSAKIDVNVNAIENDTPENVVSEKPTIRKINWLNKIGFDHQQGLSEEESMTGVCQNQDYLLISYNPNQDSTVKSIKMVLDGCGGQRNSGVGTQLFAQFFDKIPDEQKFNHNLFEHNVSSVIETLIEMFDNSISTIRDNLYFTILCVFELEDKFVVKVAGDGYILLCKGYNVVYFEQDDGEYAKYYLYNFLPKGYRGDYEDGIPFKTFEYSKNDYSNVGVTTDGFRFVDKLLYEEQIKLKDNLLKGNFAQVHMIINRNYKKFHDDITICL